MKYFIRLVLGVCIYLSILETDFFFGTKRTKVDHVFVGSKKEQNGSDGIKPWLCYQNLICSN